MSFAAPNYQTLDSITRLAVRVLLVNASWRQHQKRLKHAMLSRIACGQRRSGMHQVREWDDIAREALALGK